MATVLLAAAAHAQSVPARPTGLVAAPLDGQAALSWDDPSDSTITSYAVRYSTTLIGGTWTAISGSGPATTSHTVSSLTNGTRYYFWIRATNANGDGTSSFSADTQLAASPATAVSITDANLRSMLEAAMGKAAGASITQLDMAKLQGSLGLEGSLPTPQIAVLTGLEYAVNVADLDLSANSISALTPLASLTSLRTLSLSGNQITGLTSLAGLTTLRWLFLDENAITSLTPLAGLTGLTRLWLRSNQITDLTPLASLTALQELRLEENAIANLTPLASLTGLQVLGLSNNPMVSLTQLAGLTSLESLYLNSNQITDLTPLAGLTTLTQLALDENAITSLTPLAGLTTLTQLALDENAITSLTPLAGLTSLGSLRLNSNQITDLTPLAGLTGLGGVLGLDNNQITDLTPLAGLTALDALTLRGNQITDVAPLAGFTDTWIYLEDNLISDLAALAVGPPVSGWMEIYLWRNPLSPTAAYVHIPAMIRRGIDVYWDRPSEPPPPPPPNAAPEVARALDDAALSAGGGLTVDLLGVFSDADGETLTFTATTSRPAVATVRLDGQTLMVSAVAEGQARITVQAADPHGATTTLSFLVTVGNPVSIGGSDDAAGVAAAASVPEGGVAEVAVTMAEPRTLDVSFAYSFGPDGDPATADADAADHGGEGGTVAILAGETEATIRIPIADDDDIEPARETFLVALQPLGGAGLAKSSAVVHIEEGVCDRTWQVADALRGGRACEAVTPAELQRRRVLRLTDAGLVELEPLDFLGLAGLTVLVLDSNGLSALPAGLLAGSPALRVLRLRGNRFETLPMLGNAPALIELDLAGNLLNELPRNPFENLPALGYLYLGGNGVEALPPDLLAEAGGLRILELQDNALEALPEGIFAGVERLFSLQLQGNPGSPFSLPIELARVDADAEAEGEKGTEGEEEPGRATIQLRMPQAAPFAISAELSAPGATLSAQMATIAAGETQGGAVSVVRSVAGDEADAAVAVEITSVPNPPTTSCGDDYDEYRCFRGFELEAGSPLTLFEPVPAATESSMPRMR